MMACFPPAVPIIQGEPTTKELIRVLHHLMTCSQSHETAFSEQNLLYVCLPANLYATHTANPYPNDPPDPGPVAVIPAGADVALASNLRAMWELANMYYKDVKTMNSALTDRFLSLISMIARAEFEKTRYGNPNQTFQNTFQWFLLRYATSDENDREANKQSMNRDWIIQQGFQTLVQQIEDGIEYATFASHPIPDQDVVNIAMRVLMRQGLFTTQYEEWHARDSNQKSWFDFKTFWAAKVRLKKNTTINNSALGMNSIEEEIIQEYDNSVDHFAESHNKTQSTIQMLTQSNAQLNAALQAKDIQLSQMCQQMNFATNNPAPPPVYQQPFQQNSGGRRKKKNSNGWNGYQQQSGANRAANQQGTKPKLGPNSKRYENWNFCWSHGNDVSKDHTSATCQHRHPNHQVMATRTNPMGGNPKDSTPTISPSHEGRLCLDVQRQQRAQTKPQQQQAPTWTPQQPTQWQQQPTQWQQQPTQWQQQKPAGGFYAQQQHANMMMGQQQQMVPPTMQPTMPMMVPPTMQPMMQSTLPTTLPATMAPPPVMQHAYNMIGTNPFGRNF